MDVSAKDFRTWHGTVLGSEAMADEQLRHPADKPWSRTAPDKAIRWSVQAMAENLGNTPAVCGGSSNHPGAVELFRQGVTIARDVSRVARSNAGDLLRDRPVPADRLPAMGAAPSKGRCYSCAPTEPGEACWLGVSV